MFSSVEVIFGEDLHGIHILSIWRNYLPISSPVSVLPIFQSRSFHVLEHPTRPLAVAHQFVYSCMSDNFFFQAEYITRHSTQSVACCEDFPLLLSFRVAPERACRIAAAHFWMVPAQGPQASVN